MTFLYVTLKVHYLFFSKRPFAKMLEHFLNKYWAEISDNSIAYLKNITILTSEHHNMQYRKNYTFIHECLLIHFKFSTWGHYFCVFYWRRYWISYPVPTLRWFEIPRSRSFASQSQGALLPSFFSYFKARGIGNATDRRSNPRPSALQTTLLN